MKIFRYIRVSGRGQVEGDGFERQRAAIAEFCSKFNLQDCGEFREEAVSGTVEAMDRPAFVELIEYVENRAGSSDEVKGIVVENMDRLARDLMVSEFLLDECRKRGLKVFATDQGAPIDMTVADGDPTRVLIRQIMGALSQWVKTCIVLKLKSARDRIRVEKGHCEGQPQYGMRGGEQQVLKLIKELRSATPPMSFKKIAKHLNEAELFTRSGKEWTGAAVHSILNVENRRKKAKTK